MTSSFRNPGNILSFAVGILFVMVAAFFLVSSDTHTARAAGGDGSNGNVSGYLWSSTIGWISLNCHQGSASGGSACGGSEGGAPYSVNVTRDAGTGIGYFDGYAWSPNVGWVSFRPADVVSCGPRASLNTTTNLVSGWARVLSGTVGATTTTLGGWNGCISLRGTSSGTTPATYGVSFNPTATTNSLAGTTSNPSFAWGSVNLGWISWANAHLNLTAPVVELKVNGADTAALGSSGGSVALTWTTQNLSSADCTATDAWTGAKSSSGGSQSASVAANSTASVITKTYVITCTGLTGTTVSDTVTVTVAGSSSAGSTAPFLSFLVNGTGAVTVPSGTTVTLSWEVDNLQPGYCRGQSSGLFSGWSGPIGSTTGPLKSIHPSGSTTVATPGTYTEAVTVTSTRTYVLYGCKGTNGMTLSPRTVTITIGTAGTGTGGGTGGPSRPVIEEF